KAARLDDGVLTVGAERDEVPSAVPQAQAVPDLSAIQPPPTADSTGCCLIRSAEPQRTGETDARSLAFFLFQRFRQIDSIQVQWLGSDGAQVSTFNFKRDV